MVGVLGNMVRVGVRLCFLEKGGGGESSEGGLFVFSICLCLVVEVILDFRCWERSREMEVFWI